MGWHQGDCVCHDLWWAHQHDDLVHMVGWGVYSPAGLSSIGEWVENPFDHDLQGIKPNMWNLHSSRILWFFHLYHYKTFRVAVFQVFFLSVLLVVEQGSGAPFIPIPPAIADMITPGIRMLQVIIGAFLMLPWQKAVSSTLNGISVQSDQLLQHAWSEFAI